VALVQSKQIVSRMPVPSLDEANEPIYIFGEYVVPAGGLAINDVIEMGGVSPNMRVIDAIVHNTACGASATFDLGILSRSYGVTTGTARTCGNEFIAAGDMNATTVKRLTKSVTTDLVGATENPADDTLGWGIKVTGAVYPAAAVIRATLVVMSK